MKNLKLLSKKYFLVILFSLFFGFPTNSQEPVDIWEVGEKKPKENTTLIEDEAEKNIPQNSIYEMQSQKEGELSIEETQTLISKETKLVGIYDPAENGLDINMWSNSNGDQILNIFQRIDNRAFKRCYRNFGYFIINKCTLSRNEYFKRAVFRDKIKLAY